MAKLQPSPGRAGCVGRQQLSAVSAPLTQRHHQGVYNGSPSVGLRHWASRRSYLSCRAYGALSKTACAPILAGLGLTFSHPALRASTYHESYRTMCYSTRPTMIPFRVQFRPGLPLYEQVVYAATKAMLSGRMRPGDTFPSVRALSRELKINPNTAHKV